MKVCRQGRCSLTTAMGWVWDEAESMTGWLTVADESGGGATEMSSGKRAVRDDSNAKLIRSDYVEVSTL
jgi:hypothetical protein